MDNSKLNLKRCNANLYFINISGVAHFDIACKDSNDMKETYNNMILSRACRVPT